MDQVADKVVETPTHPPIATGVICVDFDATLYPWGRKFGYPRPLPGAVEAMQAFKGAGYTIVIFTSRMSPTWVNAEDQSFTEHQQYIEDVCERDGIPFDYITCEKVPAEYYIDDKAIEFKNNWPEVMTRVLS